MTSSRDLANFEKPRSKTYKNTRRNQLAVLSLLGRMEKGVQVTTDCFFIYMTC